MAIDFKLPDIGEGIAEGEIVKWLVSPGDSVAEHQSVVEVMTDKATVEVPAPAAGTIQKVLFKEGDVVPVGEVIFVLEEGAGGGSAAEEPAQSSAPAEQPEQSSGPVEQPTQSSAPAEQPAQSSAPAEAPSGAGRASGSGGAAAGGSTLEFKLPDIGEGIAEGEVVQWLVKEGDSVEEHQPVLEVMTDKATVEIPAPAEGVIRSIKVQAGEVVPIGTVLFDLATSGGGGASAPAPAAQQPAPAMAGAPPQASGAPSSNGHSSAKVRAVPSARRVARELGVDLSQVQGSGRGGIIRRVDVENFQPSAAPAAGGQAVPADRPGHSPVSLPAGERETRVPFRGIRRKTAEAMARSKFTATHFTVVEELDVTELVSVRAKAKEIGARDGIKVTYMPFIMKATASALARFPELNSQLDEASQELVTYHYVNLGIATDTPNGLIVPVIDEVQSKGLLTLARELGELAERTRAGQVRPDDLSGGTFTITNAGNIGGILATPIINFPEVGILGVHRIVKRPGIVETEDGDEIAVRHYMNLSISVDHRLVDGASAARFLVYMKELLENPGLLAL